MTRPLNKPPANGPSSELIAWIDHLHGLLRNLPESLPLNPRPSNYQGFGLDAEAIAEEGVWYAFNQNMEVNFQTHKMPRGVGASLGLLERGECWNSMIRMMKDAVKSMTNDGDREFLHKTWVDRIIRAAEAHGAKIPAK